MSVNKYKSFAVKDFLVPKDDSAPKRDYHLFAHGTSLSLIDELLAIALPKDLLALRSSCRKKVKYLQAREPLASGDEKKGLQKLLAQSKQRLHSVETYYTRFSQIDTKELNLIRQIFGVKAS